MNAWHAGILFILIMVAEQIIYIFSYDIIMALQYIMHIHIVRKKEPARLQACWNANLS